ncbi:ABC transporter ATP-binding protein [Oleiagrimonas sp. MCCC 1A03011]|nr:ABC transporter ATP-binding protein [Oleiagrimonas sp. MCCC 1A03011]
MAVFGYYLHLALRSLKRSTVLTALMVVAIGLGIGASITMLTVLHVMNGDPLPGRSGRLFRPYLNPLPLDFKRSKFGRDPSLDLTWPDAMALLHAHKAAKQVAMAGSRLTADSEVSGVHPKSVAVRFVTADFFTMFGVPFAKGRGWAAQDDARRAQVVVLTQALARRLLGDSPALGRTVHLGGHDFRVIGVTRPWHPRPLFYADPAGNFYGDSDAAFMPLSTSVDLGFSVNTTSGWGRDDSLTGASTSWLQFWVQLDSAAQVARYRRFLAAYAARQKAAGRFERPSATAKLYSLRGWLDHLNLIPQDVRLQSGLALGFLFVCMLNIVALLLAKFLRRGGEISVRRALGARRRDIFAQLGVESVLIGLGGGALGLGIAELGLWSVRQRPDAYAQLAHMDLTMLLSTFVLAVLASVLAGLLPAWRACRIAPVIQLKTL